MNNRLLDLFKNKKENLLAIYCTAGFPKLDKTLPLLEAIQESGADIIEIGMPFSDPIADGPTIQESNQRALENGMNLQILFDQIKTLRSKVSAPVLLMGYINPVLQFGIEKFCQKAQEVGVDGLILPDLPMFEYQTEYKSLFESYNLSNIFLVTPETSPERIEVIDQQSKGFIYVVSSSSTTGKTKDISDQQEAYFNRIQEMGLKNPYLIGFGIHDRDSFQKTCRYANGAIIGSAFIKAIKDAENPEQAARTFIQGIKS